MVTTANNQPFIEAEEKHAISLYVCNRTGVLARIALLFTKRGYNIDSLVVSHGQDPNFSWMNIEANGSADNLILVLKQLNKLIDVIRVRSYRQNKVSSDIVERELAMIKLACNNQQRNEVLNVLAVFGSQVIDMSQDTLTCQITASSKKIEALCSLLKPYNTLEIIRSGKIIIERGQASEPLPVEATIFSSENNQAEQLVGDLQQSLVEE